MDDFYQNYATVVKSTAILAYPT